MSDTPSLFDDIPDDRQRQEHRGPVTAVPLRPKPPLATRLNRNALTVAAVVAGVTVLTAVVVMSPSGGQAIGRQAGAMNSGSAVPTPARPSFLDVPPKTTPHLASQAASDSGKTGGASSIFGVTTPPAPESAGAPADVVQPPGAFASTGQAHGPPTPSVREQAYQAALNSSVLVGSARAPAAPATTVGTPQLDTSLGGLEANPAGPMMFASQQRGSAIERGAPPSAGAVDGRSSAPVAFAAHLVAAGSQFTVRAGSSIPGFLLSGVNSDLPGEVVGQTSRDVFDTETERVLLIPKGSRLVGRYDNRVVPNQSRLVVIWTRLILPDGRSLQLPDLAAGDVSGQSGLSDEVDAHSGRLYGKALLLSAIAAGVQLSQPQQSSFYAVPSTRQIAAGAAGQQLSDVATEQVRRGMDIPPTIMIRQGEPFLVMLTGDLVFDGPYVPSGSTPAGPARSESASTYAARLR